MKDLDFDELDKAVSSLMASDQKDTPANVPVSPASGPVSASVPSSPSVPSVQSSPVNTPRSTPPAARRSGRFMDMVPPAKKESTSPVSRQGTTITPTNVSPATAVPSSPPKLPEPVSTPTTPKPSVDTPTQTTDWPDPLELASAKEDKADTKKDETPDEIPVSTTSNVPEVSSSTSFGSSGAFSSPSSADNLNDESPLSSPFLPDTKVEKRPLGGAAIASVGSELMVEDENAQLPALPKDVESTLPEELHGDVASIEADNSTTDPSKHVAKQEPEVPPKKAEEPRIEKEPDVKKPVVTVTEASVPSGPTSIPQQYKEEPNSGDQKNGGIYDTDTYHQPLAHPAKKKSGWSLVLWIVVILAVGAGGGAALFLLGIV